MLTEHLSVQKGLIFSPSVFMDEEENVCGISKIYYPIYWCVSRGQKLNLPLEHTDIGENS